MNKIKNQRNLIMYLAIILVLGFMPFNKIAMAADSDILEKDTVKPVINHGYIEDQVIKLSISDDRRLASKAITYRIGKETRDHEIHVDDYIYDYDYDYKYDYKKKMGKIYEIYVEIPSDIFITIRHYADNESTYKFSIKEDNAPLTANVPEFVMERLSKNRQSTVNRFKGFDDILELEYGKVVDAFSLYSNIIKDSYYKYNKSDINFKASGLSIDKDGNIKLDKYGIFKVTMTHKMDKTFEESAYVVIKPNWRNTEKRKSPSNFSPYIVYKDKIKVADYFKNDDEATTKKSKIDTTYMLVYNEETDQTLGMNDQIDLDLNKIYKLSVLNFEDDSQQDFYVMRQEKTKSSNKNFTDLDKAHWASKDISSLVSKGVLSGYPDGSFNPSGNISIKEFMTIISRQIAINPVNVKPVVGDAVSPIRSNSWGYIESKSILDRIPANSLRRFNYLDMDRDISREEVAFLINNVFILETPYITGENKYMYDMWKSIYVKDIANLLDLDIISGYPDGTFRPKNSITRAEISALITRIK